MLLKFLEVLHFLLLLLMLKMGILCGIVCAMLIVCVQNVVVLLATWFYKPRIFPIANYCCFIFNFFFCKPTMCLPF